MCTRPFPFLLGFTLALLLGACSCDEQPKKPDSSVLKSEASEKPGGEPEVAAPTKPSPAELAQRERLAAEEAAAKEAASKEQRKKTLFERYASYSQKPPPPACDKPGVILNVTWPSQHSRLTWLKELLRAEPELRRLLTEEPSVRLQQLVYGKRNYGRLFNTSDISRQALVVECDRAFECLAVAGFYERVDPFARIEHYCGMMPAKTGGNFPLDLEKLAERPISYPHGVCARLRACSAKANLPAPTCDGLAPISQACAEEVTCEASLACFDQSPRDPKRKLWSDEPAIGF